MIIFFSKKNYLKNKCKKKFLKKWQCLLYMNRQDLLGFFLQKRRNYTILCGRCQKDDCYNCNRFTYIREQLEKKCFFRKTVWTKE